MRELKFKVWDKDEKEFVKLGGDTFIAFDDGGISVVQGDENYGYKYENIEIVDYAGLKDKNGKEIYDKFLLKDDENFIWEVYFDNGCFRMKCDDLVLADELLNSRCEYCEVVGSTFENSEQVE